LSVEAFILRNKVKRGVTARQAGNAMAPALKNDRASVVNDYKDIAVHTVF
jgi:hypothetical protein